MSKRSSESNIENNDDSKEAKITLVDQMFKDIEGTGTDCHVFNEKDAEQLSDKLVEYKILKEDQEDDGEEDIEDLEALEEQEKEHIKIIVEEDEDFCALVYFYFYNNSEGIKLAYEEHDEVIERFLNHEMDWFSSFLMGKVQQQP